MFLAVAAVFGIAWIIAFAVVHVTGVAVHTLLALAVVSALVHVIRPRKYLAPAGAPPPNDAVK